MNIWTANEPFGYDTDRAAAILNIGVPISFVLFWAVWSIGEHVI